jgi:hypothetical protein
MQASNELRPEEHLLLTAIAVVGGLGLNGVFLCIVLWRRDLFRLALTDPVAWVLMIEALIVTGTLAWLFARRGVSRIGPVWFWVISLAGGLALSIPVALLSPPREERRDS